MSSDTLILELSANLAPVRRRRMLREGGLVVALGLLELVLFLGFGMMRHDMGHIAGSPYLLWRMGSLALIAGITCALAIRSFSPTARPRRGLVLTCAFALLAIVAGVFVAPAGVSHQSLLTRINPAHGLLCAASIFVLSLPVLAILSVLMRNAAPTQPKLSALAAGMAAGTWGALIFAFCCPFNDPLYVIVWYSVGCSAVAVAARWRLPKGFNL